MSIEGASPVRPHQPRILRHIGREDRGEGLALVGEGRIVGVTKSQQMRESAVMISSTMPSAKYSCSGSPLIFAKGSTAIDGLSGSAKPAGYPHPPRAPGARHPLPQCA
jgi:hypothetical protein